MYESPHASMKQCYACHQSFPATSEFFCRNKSKKDGLHDACKTCDKARRKAYTESHREQEHQSRKRFRENNVERLSEDKKRYRESHKEQIAQHQKQWQQGESYKAYQRRYHQEHGETISQQAKRRYNARREYRLLRQRLYLQTENGKLVDKAHRHRRRARKIANGGSCTAQQLQEQLQRQKSKCYYCKAKLGKVWHADHVVPLSRGGSNSIDNVVIACAACNQSKHARLPHEWPEGGRLL